MTHYDLFRKAALDNTKSRIEGEVLVVTEPTYTILTVILSIFILVSLIFLAGTSFSSYETVKGTLNLDGGVLKIYPAASSTVTKLMVSNGQEISEGDTLALLKPETSKLNGTINLVEERKFISLQIENLKMQKKKEKEHFLFLSKFLKSKKRNLERQLSILEEKLRLRIEREELSYSEYRKSGKLYDRNGISLSDYNIKKSEYLSSKSLVKDLESEREVLTNQLDSLDFDLKDSESAIQIASLEIDNEIYLLENKFSEITNLIELKMVSPSSGIVANVTTKVGELISTDRPLMSVTPVESNLYAELYVPSRSIGFIEEGLDVRMRIDAYPVSKYGDIKGSVYEINRVLSMPDEWSNPLSLSTPIYRVKVALDEQFIQVDDKEIQLQGGLHLEADIILEKQSIFESLVAPIVELKNTIH